MDRLAPFIQESLTVVMVGKSQICAWIEPRGHREPSGSSEVICDSFPSQVLLGHPDLQIFDPLAKVDLLLLTEWVTNAKGKLLQQVQVRPLTAKWNWHTILSVQNLPSVFSTGINKVSFFQTTTRCQKCHGFKPACINAKKPKCKSWKLKFVALSRLI